MDALLDRSRISRRQVLSAAALLFPACVSMPKPARGSDSVVVVGAGLAGLTAAYRLQQANVNVRVFEAQTRVGGRCFSLRGHFADGQVAELGGEMIDSGHRHIRALAGEMGLALDDLAETGSYRDLFEFGGQRYSERDAALAFGETAHRIQQDLNNIAGEIGYRHPDLARELDAMSIAEWLDRAGVSGWFRKLLEVAYTTEYGLEVGEQSSLNLLLLIGADPFKLFGESDERYHIRGGNDQLAQRLGERLQSVIQTEAVLEAVRERANGELELTARVRGRSVVVSASHVILAIPFSLLRHVRLDLDLPPAKRRAIERLAYGTNSKRMLGFSARVWRAQRYTGSVVTDRWVQSLWETSRSQSGTHGILTHYAGGHRGAGPEQEGLVPQLDALFPGVAAHHVAGKDVQFHWPTHEWSLGSYACYRPGDWTTIHGAEAERVKNLHFAGEHCSANAQGFLEGAVESGEVAAAEVLSDLRVQRSRRNTGISAMGA